MVRISEGAGIRDERRFGMQKGFGKEIGNLARRRNSGGRGGIGREMIFGRQNGLGRKGRIREGRRFGREKGYDREGAIREGGGFGRESAFGKDWRFGSEEAFGGMGIRDGDLGGSWIPERERERERDPEGTGDSGGSAIREMGIQEGVGFGR